ncbi:Large subunit ribosomal protein L37e [Forsythia ovata]|uniref:Large subunit ribosomal protein L37e n=1 Tax=Forsythia ovata TaxID=205694 RepID=A0ABD1V0Z3_9LAMI
MDASTNAMTSFVPCEIVPSQQVNLKPNCPIPPLACTWYKCIDDIASEWESPYKARIEAFKKMIGTEVTDLHVSEELEMEGVAHPWGREQRALVRGETRHTLCVRYGRRSFHIQKSRCSAYAYPAARKRTHKWSVKAIKRKTTVTGCMMYLRYLPRRFREGSQAAPRNNGAAASA